MSETKTISLVIGGGGFIGSHLCLSLLKAGHIVISVDKQFPHLFKMPTNEKFQPIHLDLSGLKEDLSNCPIAKEIVSAIDRPGWRDSLNTPNNKICYDLNIFNLACESNTMNKDFTSHVTNTEKIIKLANEMRSLIFTRGIYGRRNVHIEKSTHIFASSASIYGNTSMYNEWPFKETQSPNPESVYAWSKLRAESLFSPRLRDKLKIFRFFNVFGEFEGHKIAITQNGEIQTYQSKVFQMREAAKYGRESVLFGSGNEKRDFISVDTVCDVLTNHDKKEPGIYNLGSGRATSFNEVKEILLTKYPKAKFTYKECPYPFFQKYTCADMSKSPEIIPEVEFQKLRHFLLA